MRMHSSLTRGSLYGRGRPGPDPSWRRLRSLSLALLLVLLLMQQASDPQVYRNFFTKLGVPLAATPTTTVAPAQPSEPTAGALGRDDLAAEPLARQFAEQLDRETVDGLTATLARARRGELSGTDDEVLARLRSDLQRFAQSLQPSSGTHNRVSAWIDALEPPVTRADIIGISRWLQPALDAIYLRQVRDASVWHADDAAALFRYLELAQDPATLATTTPTGVLPLLDQADVYRGRAFQMTGRAVRAEKISGRENPFRIDSYWVVWLNPEDGSNRPAVFYAPHVPEAIEQLSASATTLDGPRVTARGVYVKRLLYQSTAGAETAPALVGELTSHEPATVAVAADEALPLWLIAGIACAVGIAFAAWVYWASGREARRRRSLRDVGRPAFDAGRSLASLETRKE